MPVHEQLRFQPNFPFMRTSGGLQRLVWQSLKPTNWNIYYFDALQAAPRQITSGPGLNYDAVLSPDGRWVVFTSERTGTPPSLRVRHTAGRRSPTADRQQLHGGPGGDLAGRNDYRVYVRSLRQREYLPDAVRSHHHRAPWLSYESDEQCIRQLSSGIFTRREMDRLFV